MKWCISDVVQGKALTLQQLVNIWRNYVKQLAQCLHYLCDCNVVQVNTLTLQQLGNIWRHLCEAAQAVPA
jgi:hypothetical protein